MLNHKRIEDITDIHTKMIKLERENDRLLQENHEYKNIVMMFEHRFNKTKKTTAAFPFNLSQSQENISVHEIDFHQELIHKVTDNYESVSKLNIGLHSIEESISLIRDISMQAEQLGVNITSIASRAEEYGRGLKVIGDLVTTLARRTQKVTHDITTDLQSLKQNSLKIYESSNFIESISSIASKKL